MSAAGAKAAACLVLLALASCGEPPAERDSRWNAACGHAWSQDYQADRCEESPICMEGLNARGDVEKRRMEASVAREMYRCDADNRHGLDSSKSWKANQ